MKTFLVSVEEAEVGAVLINTQSGVSIRTTLEDMGHNPPGTPVECNNSATTRILNATVRQLPSHTIGMRFYWVRDHIHQGQFSLYRKPGTGKI